MLTDKTNVLELAALMLAHGIRDIVLCPGSRNIPLVHTFTNLEEMNCYAVTDERSAGFFALGLALHHQRPAAVCCTSGTALLNLHPAMAEARYQQVPLLVLSADRPAAWIDQMDGQTLKQPGVFEQLDIRSFNVPEFHTEEERWFGNRQINEALDLLEDRHPVHINLPLSEPLYNFNTPSLPETRIIRRTRFQPDPLGLEKLVEATRIYKKIMVLIGQRPAGKKTWHLPQNIVCLEEHLSNRACQGSIGNFDRILLSMNEQTKTEMAPDLLIYVGGHIVSKRFKQFIRQHPPLEQWRVNADGKVTDLFQCLSRIIQCPTELFLDSLERAEEGNMEFRQKWQQASDRIQEPSLAYSEMDAVRKLIHRLPSGSVLHLANSSAVRYAQFYPLGKDIEVQCNRGTSGIEGSLSTAAGYASASEELNFVLIGDLSFFYDANALWNQHVGANLRILLLNNGGGEIFKNLPGLDTTTVSGPFILGDHTTSARAWAEERGFLYLSAKKEEELEEGLSVLTGYSLKPVLLEVETDREKDSEILKGYYNKLKNK